MDVKKNRQNTHLLFGGLNADGGKVSTNTISTTERLFLIHYAKKKIRNGYNDKYLTGSLENVEILSRGIKLVTKLMRLIISDQKNQRVFSFLFFPPPFKKQKSTSLC